MVQVLSPRMQQCLSQFTMLLIEGSFETGLFRHLSNYVFGSLEFRINISYEGHLFFRKCSKFSADFQNEEKNAEKDFCL